MTHDDVITTHRMWYASFRSTQCVGESVRRMRVLASCSSASPSFVTFGFLFRHLTFLGNFRRSYDERFSAVASHCVAGSSLEAWSEQRYYSREQQPDLEKVRGNKLEK